ncbi:MAG: hypothetical protein ABIZ34_06280 [Candidatus Limnocylindrales bacterium]
MYVRRSRALLSVGFLVGTMTAWAAAPATAGTSPFTFVIDRYDNCVRGTAPADADLTVRLRAPTGSLVEQQVIVAAPDGLWLACFNVLDPIRPGRTLRVTDGVDARTLVIPNVTLRLDRETDVASGKAPAGSQVRLKAFDCPPGARFDPDCPRVANRLRSADSQGRYSTDFTSSFDARGADYVELRWKNSFEDLVILENRFPHMRVFLDADVVGGSVKPGQAATLTLRDSPGGTVIGSDEVVGNAVNGNFNGDVGAAVAPGTRIVGSFATDAKLNIPADVSIGWDDGTDTITVHCVPNQGLRLDWFFSAVTPKYVVADSTGEATVVLQPGDLDTSVGNRIEMTCASAAGDLIETSLEIAGP